ncbi:MAG: hypothetical protein KBS64_05545 [Treponema sp.]|nr:hypothetical protein [Candidatus Treponema equi]
MKSFTKTTLVLSSLLFLGQSVYAAKGKSERNSLDLYPEEFSAIILDADDFCASGDYENAAACFDERIYSYHKDDISEKTLVRLELISADIQKQVRDYKKLQMDKAAKKIDFSKPGNYQQADSYFSKFAVIINKTRDLGQQIQSAGTSGYPYYLSRFILGVVELPDSGLAGTFEQQYDAEIEDTLNRIWTKTESSCKIIETALKDDNIFTNADTLSKAEPEFQNLITYSEELSRINEFRGKLKKKDSVNQRRDADFKQSMSSIATLCNEGKKLFTVLGSLQKELKKTYPAPADKIASIRSENDTYAEALVASASNLSAWGKTAATSAKSHSLSVLSSMQDEKLSWQNLVVPYRQASYRAENKCTQSAIAMWVAIADYYSETGKLLYEEDSAFCTKLKGYMQGTDGIYYPSRCVADLEKLKTNIRIDKEALEGCKAKLNNGYIYRSNFMPQQATIAENSARISALEKEFNTIEADANGRLLKAQLVKNEIDVYYNRAKEYNAKNNFQQSFSNLQSANSIYTRSAEDLKNDGDIQKEVFEKLAKLRNEIIEKQQPVFNREIRVFKTEARTAYYAGDFERASSALTEADSKRDMWARLLDITMEPDTELEKIKNYVNTAIAIKEGREIQPYDAKAPEMRQNLSLAGQFYDKGEKLIAEGKRSEAEAYLNKATEKINQVKIYYPRNKTASLLALKITKVLDEKNFDAIFKSKVDELKQVNYSSRSALAQESYSSLLDLYEMNPKYPGLKTMVETAEYSLGLKQRPQDKSGLAKANKLAQEAQELLGKAGRDPILLQQAKEKAQSAIDLNSDNSLAMTVLDEIALRTGQQSAIVLSAEDESLYQAILADLQKNKVFDANAKLTKLLKNEKNSRSAKILKLKKRIEAQL